jgi:FKBP-type peptidyl-prolyl cis-trans isomerase FklB
LYWKVKNFLFKFSHFKSIKIIYQIMSVSDRLKALREEKAAANLNAAEMFLADNATKQGVVVLSSGLQYQILVEGNGERPALHHVVTCHYHGTLISGEVFDSSVKRGRPASFPVNGVIKGWIEALQLMPVGSKWRLFLHPNLAYGDKQVSALIGPNCSLIFDVELISFQ